ncbi:MAG: hydroxymethylglutaryl-CoA reductase [Gammaproteobacteria bacterium]|nr:hydroxymethylglutaryl-CoA reductase [Gammaproteobacteria bacterium]
MLEYAAVPLQWVGPVLLKDEYDQSRTEEVYLPLATYESPLWPSTNRGAKVTRLAGGLNTTLVQDQMTRSIALEAKSGIIANKICHELNQRLPDLAEVVACSSSFAKLLRLDTQIYGRVIYLRFAMDTADASGHNMVTKAADHLLEWALHQYPELKHISVSGNYCVDKKVSAVNGILGRGKSIIADCVVPREHCLSILKTTPEQIVDLHVKKNLMGGIIAGSLRTANAHFANMLLAFYLATGQDAANIVEGSQGMVQAELEGEDLYFSVTLPNIIVGTIGNGKHHAFVKDNLERLGCLIDNKPGVNAQRLARCVAAAVWCGEISLLAAQTNPGELMRSHFAMERNSSINV